MSYLVLARKWRPTTFQELVGQQHVVQTLTNAIATGRVHHAFLFTGCRGVGKTSAARILAKALNCEEGLSVTPCGHCTNCQEIAEGNSPDVYEIDGASNTSVDNIRELRESVRYLPAKSRFKIYIIDEVHMLSTSAFNALLKTLEEPPPHVKFIFATTEPQKIPITILSRCQRFDFRRVSGNEMLARLRQMMDAENINIDDQALRVIIRESQGSMRDAQSLLEQAIAFCGDDLSEQRVIEAIGAVDRHYVEEALQGIVLRDPGRALLAINHVYGAGHDLVDFTSLLANLLRDLAVVAAGLSANLLERSENELAMMRNLSAAASAVDLQRYFSFISATARELRTAPIPKLILDMAVLKCCAIETTHNLGAILNEMRNIYAGAPVKPTIDNNYQFAQAAPKPAMPLQAAAPAMAAGTDNTAAVNKAVIATPEKNAREGFANQYPEADTKSVTKPQQAQDEMQPEYHEKPADSFSSQPNYPAPEEEPPIPDDSYAAYDYEETTMIAPPEDLPPNQQPAPKQAPAIPAYNQAAWADFVTRLSNEDPTLGPVLEHAYLVQFCPETLQVAFKNNDFYRSYLSTKEHAKQVTDFAKNYWGTATKFAVVNYSEQFLQKPLCEQESAKEQNRLRELHQQAENDPRVKSAIQILDGSLDSIKIL